MLLVGVAGYSGCGGGSDRPSGGGATNPTAPSNAPSIVQGTVALEVFQLAVLNFSVNGAGTIFSRVDWNTANNDIDTALVRGRCTVTQVLAEAPGCTETAAIATDDTLNKPSVLSAVAQPGDHTLLIFNFGPGADTTSYRLEGSVSGATSPMTSPVRRTETFAFTLRGGSQNSVVVGPVRAGNGPVEVVLSFSGNFIILACVGTPSSCMPMGGRPTTSAFNIPTSFPAGAIQASVYFNPSLQQPTGDASGTVSFTYNPQ